MNGISLQINVSSITELKNILDAFGQSAPVTNISNVAMGEAPAIPSTPSTNDPTPPTTITSTEPIANNTPIAAPATAEAPTATVPTTAPQYTFNQLSPAAATFAATSKANRDAALALFAKYGNGVPQLTAVPAEHYGALATELRQLGAQI